ncbi:MAG TPA: DUF1127 domain-containing protein [Xanthobacteraceae bacterium]|nr:DUF1127 domain-containing protein [Xanthobacteraceae bacterium]
MTTLSLTYSAPVSAFERALDAVAVFFAGASEGQEIARRYERLSRQSERALARGGLTRADVARVAIWGR